MQSVLTPISSIIKQGNQFSVKLTSGTTGLPLVGRTVAITVNDISHNYVSRINYDYYGGAVNSVLNTLLSFEGNCIDQSSSLIALARAVSLPVRYVIGLPIEDGKDGHAWAQICIDNIFIVSDPTNINSFGDGSIVSQVYTGYEYGVLVT